MLIKSITCCAVTKLRNTVDDVSNDTTMPFLEMMIDIPDGQKG